MENTLIRGDTALLAMDSPSLAVGFRALLLSVPNIKQVDRVTRAADVIECVAQLRPVLIVLDSELFGLRLPDLLRSLRRLSPETRRLIVSDRVSDARELSNSNSQAVVVKGVLPSCLAMTIEELLNVPHAAKAA